ncbi:MFS transporter [uncultured Massilia sp.]|uniref:MFS transporter n=1 Tax=uncultured Massilia sp. TaxID=169973 RepID=UPI0025E91AFF|nr:MFS transporter [uncultured Massilia sp.]
MNDTALDAAAVARAAPRGPVRNAAIGLVMLALFTGTAARYVLSPIQELVKADLGLGDNQVALLQGLALALPTALISLPMGRLVDRTRRNRLLAWLALLCAAGSVLGALAQDFAGAFVARMMIGAAVAAGQPAALSLVADLTEPAVRGRMVTLISLGQVAGSTVAYALAGVLLAWLPAALPAGGALAALAPWRLVLLAFAAAVLASSVALLFLREPARREAGAQDGTALRAALRALWGYRHFLLPLAGGMVTIGMADAAAAIWAVPILTRNFHQAPADFGAWMGMLNLVSGIVGAVLGGVTADLGQRRRGHGGALAGAVAGAALSIPAALFAVAPGVGGFAILLALLLTAGACANIAATSAVMVVLPNRLRGTCLSLLVAGIALVAFGIAPLLVSLGARALARDADLTVPLACVGVVTSILATVAFARAMRAAGHAIPSEPTP